MYIDIYYATKITVIRIKISIKTSWSHPRYSSTLMSTILASKVHENFFFEDISSRLRCWSGLLKRTKTENIHTYMYLCMKVQVKLLNKAGGRWKFPLLFLPYLFSSLPIPIYTHPVIVNSCKVELDISYVVARVTTSGIGCIVYRNV